MLIICWWNNPTISYSPHNWVGFYYISNYSMRRTLRMKRCDIPLSASSASACHNGPKLLVVVVVDFVGSCTLANGCNSWTWWLFGSGISRLKHGVMLGYHFVHFQSCTCSESLILPTQISIHPGRKHVALGMLPLPVRLRWIPVPTNVRILLVARDCWWKGGGHLNTEPWWLKQKRGKKCQPDCYGSRVFFSESKSLTQTWLSTNQIWSK